MIVEKSGMLVNADNEVIGWVNSGDECQLKNGDSIVSHHKTAEKKGLLDKFNELKAENAPVKAKREPKVGADGEVVARGPRGPRVDIPKEGLYDVLTTKALDENDTSVRQELLNKLLNGNDFAAFWEGAPDTFTHAGRDGVAKEFKTSGLVSYAIRRGMIKVASAEVVA